MDRIARDWKPIWWWTARYALAVVTVLAAVVLRSYLKNLMERETPFLLLFASVLVSSAFAGMGPGILATVLGGVASSIYFAPPLEIGVAHVDQVRLVLFVVEGLFISILGARLQRARQRAEMSEAEARRLEQKILDISDDERRRFGQDLHDGLGQHLTGVAFLSKALQQRLAQKSLPEAEDATKIAALVSESIGQTRALAKGLAPVGLEDAGLPGALMQLSASTVTVFGVECIFRCEHHIEPLDLAVATHLYRIAQEAISNAIRHGQAKQVIITLSLEPPRLELTVRDDGIGMLAKHDRTGLGLQIMRYRAKMLGGTLDILQPEGGGTVVRCATPLYQRREG